MIFLDLFIYSSILSLILLDRRSIGTNTISQPIVIAVLIGLFNNFTTTLEIAIPLQFIAIAGTSIGIGVPGNWSFASAVVLITERLLEKFSLIPSDRSVELNHTFLILLAFLYASIGQKIEEIMENERVIFLKMIKEHQENIISLLNRSILISLIRSVIYYFFAIMLLVLFSWLIIKILYFIIQPSFDGMFSNICQFLIPAGAIGALISTVWGKREILIFVSTFLFVILFMLMIGKGYPY